MEVAPVANSFKKSFKHTVRQWPRQGVHLVRALEQLALFAVGITAPLTVLVVYPLVALWERRK